MSLPLEKREQSLQFSFAASHDQPQCYHNCRSISPNLLNGSANLDVKRINLGKNPRRKHTQLATILPVVQLEAIVDERRYAPTIKLLF